MTSNHDDKGTSRSRIGILVGIVSLLAAFAAIIWWPGCREYPPVTSRESLGLLQLLNTACNTKDTARLAKVEAGLEKLVREGKLNPQEKASFDKIIGLAKSGNWQEAEDAAFKMAQDQVGAASPPSRS